MTTTDPKPAIATGFGIGSRVTVTGGKYAGDDGVVVERKPDLRPGCAWVDLTRAGIHLVPSYRLVPRAA